MENRSIAERVQLLGAADWNRRLFDALIPLPDGTSYNAYLVRGSGKTAIIDTADPTKADLLMEQLADVDRVDYLVANHAEQDHSGTIPRVLERYPEAVVLATPKGNGMLVDLKGMGEEVVRVGPQGSILGTYSGPLIRWVTGVEVSRSSVLPILWSCGTGSEVMKPLAAPVVGGMVSSLILILIVTPILFTWLREREMRTNDQ